MKVLIFVQLVHLYQNKYLKENNRWNLHVNYNKYNLELQIVIIICYNQFNKLIIMYYLIQLN